MLDKKRRPCGRRFHIIATRIKCPLPDYFLRPSRGGGENAAITAPHAVITVGIAFANCGAASLMAWRTTLDGRTAASAPRTAMAAPTIACAARPLIHAVVALWHLSSTLR
jgi:hypothetical protein